MIRRETFYVRFSLMKIFSFNHMCKFSNECYAYVHSSRGHEGCMRDVADFHCPS